MNNENSKPFSGISPWEILQDVKNNIKKTQDHAGSNRLLLVKPVNEWIEEAKKRKIPEMLFSEFWFESELSILFADTNLGKSILAVQIADSISQGKPLEGFWLEAPKQPVIYFDFELSDKQFEARYSNNYSDHYMWADHFYRVELNPEGSDHEKAGFKDFESHLYSSIEKAIKETGAKVLVIDNITYLKSETESAKFAMPLMKQLHSLKKKYGLSILVLAHTPKRDLSTPLTRNDLQGSKMLINFCDSSFAIGESHDDKNIRYLKQIKARNTEIKYDAENVCLFQISKPSNYLHFEFISNGIEKEHLKKQSNEERDQIIQKVKEMANHGHSQREISKEFGISVGAVNKYIRM